MPGFLKVTAQLSTTDLAALDKDSQGGSKDTIKKVWSLITHPFCISTLLCQPEAFQQHMQLQDPRRPRQKDPKLWKGVISLKAPQKPEYAAALDKQNSSQICSIPYYQVHWQWESCSPAPATPWSPGLKDSSTNQHHLLHQLGHHK